MTRIEQLFELAQGFYTSDDPGHDLAHIQRVMQTCSRLATAERANGEIALAGAILHDIVNLPKNHPERKRASQMAAEKGQELLRQVGFSATEIDHVSQVVIEHSFSLGKKPSSIESAILQDADRLDALGAIGVMRTVSCGVRLGAGYYSSVDPFARGRDLDDHSFTIDHFSTKLFKLPELMNTESARAEANARVGFMRDFLQQLEREISLGD